MHSATPLDIKFAPGVLEQLELTHTPDEVQEFMDYITQATMSGNTPTGNTVVDMDVLKIEDPELHEAIINSLEAVEDMEYTTPVTLQ